MTAQALHLRIRCVDAANQVLGLTFGQIAAALGTNESTGNVDPPCTSRSVETLLDDLA